MFSLGDTGKEFRRLVRVTDAFAQAQRWLERINTYSSSYLDPRTFQLVSVHPVPPSESADVQLMAVSSAGFRLYFSFFSGFAGGGAAAPGSRPASGGGGGGGAAVEPTRLQLVFVRPPSSAVGRERLRLHDACYADGVLVLANSFSDDADSVVCISREKEHALELTGSDKLEGKTWSISALPAAPGGEASAAAAASGFLALPGRARRFVVLTNS
ncbi:hypothetical protein HK405_013934, partial [Cladochytrium tenue]